MLLPDNKSDRVQQVPVTLHHIINYCLFINTPDTTPRASTHRKACIIQVIDHNTKATVKPKT